MKIYQSKVVEKLREFYEEDNLLNLEEMIYVKDYLSVLADKMYEGVILQKDFIFQEINNYHKDFLGKPIQELKALNLTFEDCQTAIANEYGFESWEIIPNDIEYDDEFEITVGFLLNGRLDFLKAAIEEKPDLIFRKSKFGHEATLLHYVASNGVEFWRQIVPENLPEITKFLIEKGADKDSKMKVYRGEFSVLPLLESSAHPFAAGVADELIEILK